MRGNPRGGWVCRSWHQDLHRPAKWGAGIFLLGSLACSALDCRTKSGEQIWLVMPVPRWLVYSLGIAQLISVVLVAVAHTACKRSCRDAADS
jgi:hypothetical protein